MHRNSDTELPGVKQVWTNDEGTMAWETARSRWAHTIQNMVEDVKLSLESGGPKQRAEGELLVSRLLLLKCDVEQDDLIRPLQEDGREDILGFNDLLGNYGPISWKCAPWLYAECHLYRHVETVFSTSAYWRGYDVFARQKIDTFVHSREAVQELSSRYLDIRRLELDSNEKGKMLFEEMVQISLWGNATDLSLLSNLSLEEIQQLQGSEAIKRNQQNIVDNDIEDLWTYVSQKPLRQVDIVLDNSGFELFTDLVFALYLLDRNFTSNVVLHPKSFPWFVSDVTPKDLRDVLDGLSNEDWFPRQESMAPVAQMLREAFDSGKITVKQHSFWTSAYSFHSLPTRAPDLMQSLKSSDLVVFKGDLNYRKLTHDGQWPYTTPFATAIGPLGEGSGVRVLALRTNKADVCVGVDRDRLARLQVEAPRQAWIRNGKYAVISCNFAS